MAWARKQSALVGALAALLLMAGAAQASAPSTSRVADAIKSDVAQMVAGINAHDVARATQFDAPDVVSMESGRAPSNGVDADRQGLGMAFQYAPSWRLTMLDEAVDVAPGGAMAIYRGTYNEDSTENGVAMTHVVNFIAEFRKQPDGAWKIELSVVCAQQRSHPAGAAAASHP